MELALPVIGLFLAGMTGVGLWHAKRVKTSEDFVLAGRGLPTHVLAGTLVATWIGTGSLFGNAEFAFTHGVAGLFLPVSGLVGMLVLAYLAPRVRGMSAQGIPDIVGIPFGDWARRIAAVALIAAYLVIVSYQYRAGAAVAQRILPGLPAAALPVFFALFVILYTALAGMVSVAWTDVVNGAVMSVGLLAALAIVGLGWDSAAQPLPASHWNPGGGLGFAGWTNVMLPSFLLLLGDANLYQRFLSAESPKAARSSAIATFFGLLVLESAIILLAILAKARLPEAPANPGHAIIEVAFTLVPSFVGLMLCATAVAVIVSTADSYLLACTTTVASGFGQKDVTPAKQRTFVAIFGVFALWISFWSDKFLSVALYAYTLYGASLTPAVLCALLRPKTKPRAVVGGMAAGLFVALAWKAAAVGGDWDPVLPALAANLGTLILLEKLPGGERA
jgi:Na+/proline symporter